jgi:hypothetical protein
MASMERAWNALALGGVVGTLLAIAGVVNLGDLPSWSSLRMTPTSPAVIAEGTEEAVETALAQPTSVEQIPLPGGDTTSEVADQKIQDATGQDPAEDNTLAAVVIEEPVISPPSSEPPLSTNQRSRPAPTVRDAHHHRRPEPHLASA